MIITTGFGPVVEAALERVDLLAFFFEDRTSEPKRVADDDRIHIVSIINMIINPIVIPTTKFLGNITHRIYVCYIWCAMDPINKKPIHVSIYTIHESMVISGSELMEVR